MRVLLIKDMEKISGGTGAGTARKFVFSFKETLDGWKIFQHVYRDNNKKSTWVLQQSYTSRDEAKADLILLLVSMFGGVEDQDITIE